MVEKSLCIFADIMFYFNFFNKQNCSLGRHSAFAIELDRGHKLSKMMQSEQNEALCLSSADLVPLMQQIFVSLNESHLFFPIL